MTKFLSRFVPSALLALASLPLAATAWAQDGSAASFEPTMLALGITGLFALATLVTGTAALFGRVGWSLLISTGDFVDAGSKETVRAPNVRGWGVRQIVTGVPLWAALLLGDQVLFQAGLAALLARQALDIVLYLLEGRPKDTILFFVFGAPTVAAFVSVL